MIANNTRIITLYFKKLFNWQNLLLFLIAFICLYLINREFWIALDPIKDTPTTAVPISITLYFIWLTFVVSYSFAFLQKNKIKQNHNSFQISFVISFIYVILLSAIILRILFCKTNNTFKGFNTVYIVSSSTDYLYLSNFFLLILFFSLISCLFSFTLTNIKINYIFQIFNTLLFLIYLFFLITQGVNNEGNFKSLWMIYCNQIFGILLIVTVLLVFINYVKRSKYWINRKEMRLN